MIVFSSTRLAPIVIAMIAVVAPVSGQDRSKPSARQECSVGVRKAPEPDPPELALKKAQRDSLHVSIHSVLAGRDVGKGYLILHVDQLTGGRSLEAVDLNLSEGLLDSLALPMVVQANRSGRTVVVSFPMQRPGIGTDSVGSTYESCPPRVSNMYLLTRYLRQEVRKFPPALMKAGAETVVQVFVSERGKALASAIEQSSGNPAVDRTAVIAAMSARFDPALWNGIPTGVWVEIPIQLRAR